MTHEELVTWGNETVDTSVLKVKEILAVNHKPHPYVIGSRHVAYAADHCSGMLTEHAIEDAERKKAAKCAHPGCHEPYRKHTHDTVAIIIFCRDLTTEELRTELLKLKDKFEAEKIDGFAFLETEFEVIDQ